MAAHNSSAAKIQQNKLLIDCATSSNFLNNLTDLNGQNIDVTIDACKNSDNPYKELFGTCEYVSCQGGRVVNASGSETRVSSSTPTSAIIYDAYTSIQKK